MFFTHTGQQQEGPFSIEDLTNKRISKTDMVWREGMEKWLPAGEIDELKTLFVVVPPPLQTTPNMPPPLVVTPKTPPISENTTPSSDDKKKKRKLFIYIGAGAGALLLIASCILLVAALSGNKKDDANSVVNLKAKYDSLQAIAQNASKTPNEQIAAKDNNNLTAEEKEEALKQTYKRNWKSYISARANYSTGPAGGISNATVTISNNMPYTLDQVTIWLNYIRIDRSTYKSEKVIFYNVGPNRNETKPAPWSDKGTTVTTRISKISSKSLGFYYSDL